MCDGDNRKPPDCDESDSDRAKLISHSASHRRRRRGVHARCDVARHELLEEQLARIGDVHLTDLGRIVAPLALERVLAQIRNRNQTAD